MATTVSTAQELRDAVANAGPGSEIVARGGTYNFSGAWQINSSGSEDEQLVIRAADGERPHIEFATGLENPKRDSGIEVNEPYVTIRGFEISGSGYKGIFASTNGHDVVFEDLDVHHCNRWGIMNNGNDNVVFRNCDSHDNFDPQNEGEHSDGFNMTGPATNGLIEGCRSWNNGDDGYDFWISQNHTVRYCWAWNNGRGSNGDGNAFKLGGGPNDGGGHLVHHCVAFDNRNRGFDWNTTDNDLKVYNCTALGNDVNYRFTESGPYTLRNNISLNGGNQIADGVDDANNTWNLGISDPQFRSKDPSDEDFLRLEPSSPCIGAGVTGLGFDRETSDLGAFQNDGEDGGTDPAPDRVSVDAAVTLSAGGAQTTATRFEQKHSGHNGDGYLNFLNDEGSVATWPLEVQAPGAYNIELRYANGASAPRSAILRVGDQTRELTFPQTAGWVDWSTITGTVELVEGDVDLNIETTGEDGGNVDQILLQPVEDDDSEDEGSERSGQTPNHGYTIPEAGQTDWHVPLNQNFEAIDGDVPVVDAEGTKEEYDPNDGTLYFAVDTGAVYVGDGSEWNRLGTLS